MLRTAWIGTLTVMFDCASGAQTAATPEALKPAAAAPSARIKPIQHADSAPQGKLKALTARASRPS